MDRGGAASGGPTQAKVLKNKSRRMKSRDEGGQQTYGQAHPVNNMAYQISFSDELSVAPSQETEENYRYQQHQPRTGGQMLVNNFSAQSVGQMPQQLNPMMMNYNNQATFMRNQKSARMQGDMPNTSRQMQSRNTVTEMPQMYRQPQIMLQPQQAAMKRNTVQPEIINVFQSYSQHLPQNFILNTDDSYQSSKSGGELKRSQNRKPPISARKATEIHTGVRSRIDTGLQETQRSASKNRRTENPSSVPRVPEILDIFKLPRAFPKTGQTPGKPQADRLSRDGSVKSSKKSRNTQSKMKNESKTQLSFADESKLHENANLIFSTRKKPQKIQSKKSTNIGNNTSQANQKLPKKKTKGGKSKSKTRKSKSSKRKLEVEEENPDDSMNFEVDPHLANIMLPNARKLAPTHGILDIPKIPPLLEDSLQNSIQSLTHDFLEGSNSLPRASRILNLSTGGSRSPSKSNRSFLIEKQASPQKTNQKSLNRNRALQMMLSILKHSAKDRKRACFEKWRLVTISLKNIIMAQQSQSRWALNQYRSNAGYHSPSHLQSQDDSLIQQEMALKRGVAAIFRYKSRRLATSFSQWKYKAQFMRYMESYVQYKRAQGGQVGNSQGYAGTSPNDSSINYNEMSSRGQILAGPISGGQLQAKTLTNPKIRPFEDRLKIIQGGALLAMAERSAQVTEDLENIDENEEQEERTISSQKKTALMQNYTVGRSSQNKYNFNNPSAELDQLPYQLELFKQILQSPNKDFGRLMKHSSDSSIQYFEGAINDVSSSRRISTALRAEDYNKPVNQANNSAHIQQLNSALLTVIRRLQGQLKEVLHHWRKKADHHALSLEYNHQLKEHFIGKKLATCLGNLQSINKTVFMRFKQAAFHNWKMATQVDKKAENRRLQMYFLNNAKQEVQRSKQVLQRLYQQKHNFDLEHRFASNPIPGTSYDQSGANPYNSTQMTFGSPSQQNQQIMQLMGPYFQRNQHALPQRLQTIVAQKSNQQEMVNQIKTLCYDMLLDIMDVADKEEGDLQANSSMAAGGGPPSMNRSQLSSGVKASSPQVALTRSPNQAVRGPSMQQQLHFSMISGKQGQNSSYYQFGDGDQETGGGAPNQQF